MRSTLLLNASFEPLCAVPYRRAVVMVLLGKAELVAAADDVLHAERAVVPIPSVVRLTRFVRVPFRSRVPLSRRSLFARDGHRCQYCGRAAESIDHVVPRSRGGQHVWENVVAACRTCNSRKRDRLLHETDMVLRRAPVAPPASLSIAVMAGGIASEWEQYLPTFAESA